jgi:hypothetical protein
MASAPAFVLEATKLASHQGIMGQRAGINEVPIIEVTFDIRNANFSNQAENLFGQRVISTPAAATTGWAI